MPHLVPQEKGTKVPLTTSKLTLTIDELLKEKLVRFSQIKESSYHHYWQTGNNEDD